MRESSRFVIAALFVVVGACGGDDGVGTTESALRVTQSGQVVVTLAAIEGGAPLAIGVLLDGEPAEPVVVTLTADPLVTLDRTTLTFTPSDFDRPQPVVITAVDDANVVDGAGNIQLSAAGLDTLVVPIAIADDDEVALVGTPAGLMMMEDASATFGIALAADPGGPITVTLASTDAAGATVQPATLTFGANWATPQTVTVSGPADGDDLDEEVMIDLGGLHVTEARVPVVVLDDERVNYVITPEALALTEGGAAGTFTVRLTQPPTGSLAIAVAPANAAIASVAPATLTFTAADYATAQTVTVTPSADIDGTADASTVRLTSTGLRERVVALGVAEDAVADIPAIGGEFLMTIRPGFIADDTHLRYRVTYAVDTAAATISYSATALRVDNAQPIGDPITAAGLALADDASFAGMFDGLLPGEANPYSGTIQPVDAMKLGRIVDADFLCGTMTGSVAGVSLDGTTWGSVRITGVDLPTPVHACP